MKKSEQSLHFSEINGAPISEGIATSQLSTFIEDWLSDCDLKEHSPKTIEMRRGLLNRLIKFLWDKQHLTCGRSELRQFFAALSNSRTGEKMRPSTADTYHRVYSAFFNWLVIEEIIGESPMRKIPKPRVPNDQITPLTQDQQRALLKAAKESYFGLRNYALIRFLLDTGVRASEVCALNIEHLDLDNRKASVIGKGNKKRTVFFGKRTWKALQSYLNSKQLYPHKPVFVAESGDNTQDRLTRSGIYQVVEACGKAAHIKAVRCSPHTLRHTAAINFLHDEGQVFELKAMLGHESLAMTQKYCKVGVAELEKRFKRRSALDEID